MLIMAPSFPYLTHISHIDKEKDKDKLIVALSFPDYPVVSMDKQEEQEMKMRLV